jgi:hypothetical protein
VWKENTMATYEEREYRGGAYAQEWHSAWRRISWGAIFAGLFVALALFVTLQMLGAGIGLTTIDPVTGETPSAGTLGIGAAIWSFVIALVSLFVGGWIAGRLGWLPHKTDRLLHGLTVWAFFYIAMFYLLTTTLSTLVGGTLSVLGSTFSAAGSAASQVAGAEPVQQTARQAMQSMGLSPETIQQEIAQATQGGAQQGQQGQQTTDGLVTAVSEYFRGPQTEQDRQQLAQQIAQTTGMSQAQANQAIQNLEQQAQQAAETGEEAVNVAGTTFILLSISMMLGAVAAALGGLAAPSPKPLPPYGRDRGAAEHAEEHTYASR